MGVFTVQNVMLSLVCHQNTTHSHCSILLENEITDRVQKGLFTLFQLSKKQTNKQKKVEANNGRERKNLSALGAKKHS